jgi:hypothetical protein
MMQYTRKQIMGMNQKAFTALLKVLLESKREPLGGSVEDEESNVVSANTAKKRGEEDQSWFAEMGVGGG